MSSNPETSPKPIECPNFPGQYYTPVPAPDPNLGRATLTQEYQAFHPYQGHPDQPHSAESITFQPSPEPSQPEAE